MLVLTRRTGESIVIGNDIVVTVLEVRHDQVRIGIDAPRTVQVHREEVFAQVMRENTAAVASAADRANPLLNRPMGSPSPRKGPRLETRRVPPGKTPDAGTVKGAPPKPAAPQADSQADSQASPPAESE